MIFGLFRTEFELSRPIYWLCATGSNPQSQAFCRTIWLRFVKNKREDDRLSGQIRWFRL